MFVPSSRSVIVAAVAAVVGLVGIQQQAHATLIVNDPILTGSTPAAGQYNTAQRLNAQNPVPTVQGMAATGWVSGTGTGQPHPVDGTLDAPGAGYESGGKIVFDGSPVDNIYRSTARSIATPYTSAGTNGPVYLSGIANTAAFPDNPNNVGLRGYALMGFTNALGANATSGALAGYFLGFRATANDTVDLVLRHRNGTNSATDPLADIVLLPNATPGTSYQFLIKTDVNVIGGNQETVHWWVNPADVSSEATATSTALASGTFNDYSLQNATQDISRLTVATSNWDANAYFDEFRLGTTFTDVAGAPVPEPASLGLLAAPALLALRRRSRR
jgi:hypothetical protein